MITFGHLSSAIYIAHQEDGQNPQVQDSVAAGLKGATVFRESLPEDTASGFATLSGMVAPHKVDNPFVCRSRNTSIFKPKSSKKSFESDF
jgi:hypothetical protein